MSSCFNNFKVLKIASYNLSMLYFIDKYILMTYKIESVITENLTSDLITLSFGTSVVQVYTHGAINTLSSNDHDVTAQRDIETQLVNFTELYRQRGGNPFMGPMAGRYGGGSGEPASRIAQPGPVDIHGVFAGLPWNIDLIENNYIQLSLPASQWKNEIKNYYFFAAQKPEEFSEERQSLQRLIESTKLRFEGIGPIHQDILELASLLKNPEIDKQLDSLINLIDRLVNYAYPGEANIARRITIEDTDEQVASFLDEVWIENVSKIRNDISLDASGFHTYFNALLSEIVMPTDFWEKGKVPLYYDDNLPDVRVRILNQKDRLGRTVFIIPEGELQNPNANQIIYKDETVIKNKEVAIENWRQPGDSYHYPEKARLIEPGETSYVATRIIVVNTDEIPQYIQDYVDGINQKLQMK